MRCNHIPDISWINPVSPKSHFGRRNLQWTFFRSFPSHEGLKFQALTREYGGFVARVYNRHASHATIHAYEEDVNGNATQVHVMD
ncbi:hypothetical protein AVEN_228559-1 [Araneus ventricosus]|uniref:Uncharacterized protein n=1 Tax=Araneus ventricosus TaxID=182803 RepID=A0A4Y2RN24_ARAVE|nr:hypothetical protein AVEN_228559-1 [Araneus ventricosus]